MTEKSIEYTHAGVTLEALAVYDDSLAGPRPAVVIAHAWGGRSEVESDWARRFADLGYYAFILDMFGKDVRGSSREENAALIKPFIDDRDLLQARINAAVATVREQAEVAADRVAAIGFCFGGLCVLDLARSGADVRGVVSLHGLFMPPEPHPGKAITARVLALHGHDDPMVPVEAVNALEKELTAAGADWQIHVYGGVMHAFTNPQAADPEFGTVFNAAAAVSAWRSTRDFLADTLS